METSERVKTALRQEAEAGVLKLLESLQTLKEGDLKGLEQQVMATIFSLGRGWMEQVLSAPLANEQEPGERIGQCGHAQQLVGYRPKQVLTLLGKVTFKRAYYQCRVEATSPADEGGAGAEEDARGQEVCTHGEAPADLHWGLHGRRTSAGVRASRELFMCVLDTGRSCRDLQSAPPVADVSPPSAQSPAAAGRSPTAAGR